MSNTEKRVRAIDEALGEARLRVSRLTKLKRLVLWKDRRGEGGWPYPSEPGWYLDGNDQPMYVDGDGDVSDGFGNSYCDSAYEPVPGPFTRMVPAEEVSA